MPAAVPRKHRAERSLLDLEKVARHLGASEVIRAQADQQLAIETGNVSAISDDLQPQAALYRVRWDVVENVVDDVFGATR
jgi:hypothetical protein